MLSYELKTEKFSGPLEKLLELIEEKHLEITEFNLAQVTADFLQYLKGLNTEGNADITSKTPMVGTSQRRAGVSPRLLADFVVVAARLLLIKSKALLPDLKLSDDEEKEIKDLEAQLIFYRNFKPAFSYVKTLWDRKRFSVSRPLLYGRQAIFRPSANITPDNITRMIGALLDSLQSLDKEIQIVKSAIITLEEKINEMMGFLASASGELKFGKIRDGRERSEVIAMFLAVLHLLSEQIIKTEQEGAFSDIIIKRRV